MRSKFKFENREAEIMEFIDSKYYITECLGVGGFSYVFKVIDKKKETEHAAKFITNEAYDKHPLLLEEEASRLERVKHPHVVEFQDLIDERILLMEYFDSSSICQYQKLKRDFTTAEIRLVRNQISSALQYGHERGIIHRDVKPGNILLGSKAKLIDYGITDELEKANIKKNNISGTLGYMAPELIAQQEAIPESDFYSLGVVLFQMLTGESTPRQAITIKEEWFNQRIDTVEATEELKSSIKYLVSRWPSLRREGLQDACEFDKKNTLSIIIS